MNNLLIPKLKELDLMDSEIAVYLHLLEYGSATTSEIAKKTAILRTNCYAVLDKLTKKGLIEKKQGAKNSTYIANNPTAIIRMIEDKKRKATNTLLPELTALFNSQKSKPVIKFYEGKDQVKEIFLQMYDTEEILGFTSLKKLFDIFPDFFNGWQKEIKKRGIFLKDIVTEDSSAITPAVEKEKLGVYVEHKFLPEKYNELVTDILIWNDNIALITLKEPIFGTVIHNKYIADTLRIQFNMIWDTLPTGTYD